MSRSLTSCAVCKNKKILKLKIKNYNYASYDIFAHFKWDTVFVVNYATLPLKDDIQRVHCRTFNSIVVHGTFYVECTTIDPFRISIRHTGMLCTTQLYLLLSYYTNNTDFFGEESIHIAGAFEAMTNVCIPYAHHLNTRFEHGMHKVWTHIILR